MQKELQFITVDNYTIYGTLDSASSDTLIIFIHGLTGNQYEHHYFNAVPFFNNHGYDTFRFDLYSKRRNARQLWECSITIHSNDLQFLVDHFTGSYKKIVLVGHSLAVGVILWCHLDHIDKIVFRDPTCWFDDIEKDKHWYYCPPLDAYILNRGLQPFINHTMLQQWKSLDPADLVHRITVPCWFVFAGKYNKYDVRKPYLSNIAVKYQVYTVDNATHGFVEPWTEQQLFEYTLQCLK